MARRSAFGNVRRLSSGRWQARYVAPGGRTVNAPTTFDTKLDANAWLAVQRSELVRGAWMPADHTITFGTFSERWLAHRPLKPRTRAHYRQVLDDHILPTFADVPLRKISPGMIREWHARTALDRPTARAHAYQIVRTILGTATADELLAANPARIRGAGSAKRASKTEPASLAELETIVDALPDRYRLMALLACWCAMRYGELAELRGHDIDTRHGVIRVRRAVVWVNSKPVIGDPKSAAGRRDVAVPPHLLPVVREHLLRYGVGRDGLLFPASRTADVHMRPASLFKVWDRARTAAGRPDLRFHDLRHTGAVLAASTGATLAELMARLGHTTPSAAMRYQHAAKGRDAEIAAALSKIANGEAAQ